MKDYICSVCGRKSQKWGWCGQGGCTGYMYPPCERLGCEKAGNNSGYAFGYVGSFCNDHITQEDKMLAIKFRQAE